MAQAILDRVRPRPAMATGPQACFIPIVDQLILPAKESFTSPESYYATTFHELTHWTGHKDRLARDSILTAAPFGSAIYSQEELVAEMGAGFLCALAGIENKTIDQSASYLDHWLGNLKADPAMLVRAAAQAQKAVDFLAPDKAPAAAPVVAPSKEAVASDARALDERRREAGEESEEVTA